MTSFAELLLDQFDKNADKPAIIYHGEILTFGQLESKARGIGAFLQDKGLERGDRVILYTPEKKMKWSTLSTIATHASFLLPANKPL